jgi:hypothetical protein
VPELVLFCNEKGLLDDSYRRFLEARIREVEPWEGLPIKIFFRERGPRTPGTGSRRKKPEFDIPRMDGSVPDSEAAPSVRRRGAATAVAAGAKRGGGPAARGGAAVRKKSARK